MPSQRILLFHIDGIPWYGPADEKELARLVQIILTPSPQAIEAILSALTAQSLPGAAAQEVAPTAEGAIGAGRQAT